jgi:hypothetical protein
MSPHQEALKQPDMFIEKPKPATQVSFAELWKAPYWNEEGTAPRNERTMTAQAENTSVNPS